jgi:hypothetical protein
MRPEHSLVDLLQLHTDLMVAGSEIELGEESGAMEFIQELIDDRDGESVLDGDGVQRAVVDAEPPRVVRLLDEEDRGQERRAAAPNNPLVQHGRTLTLQFILVQSGVSVRSNGHRWRPRHQGDAVVTAARLGQVVRLVEDVDARDANSRDAFAVGDHSREARSVL